jgi:hypothetical protein
MRLCLALSLVLGAAACTNPDSGHPEASPSGGVSSVSPDGIPYAQITIESPVEMPFEPYYQRVTAGLQKLADSVDFDQEKKRIERFELFIAECMGGRGFAYYPEPLEIDLEEEAEEVSLPAPGVRLGIPWLPATLAEAERFGYGISPPRPDDGPSEEPLAGPALQNRNYRDGLSSQAQREYDIALLGYHDYESAANPDPSACWLLALENHPADAGPDMSFLEPFDEMGGVTLVEITFDDQMRERRVPGPGSVYGDSRILALNDQYTACVTGFADSTWDLSEVSDPNSMIGLASSTAPDGSRFDWAAAGGAVALDAIPTEQQTLVGSEIEIAIAVADFKCRQETDYVNQFAAVLVDIETKHLQQYGEELDRALAQLEELLANL